MSVVSADKQVHYASIRSDENGNLVAFSVPSGFPAGNIRSNMDETDALNVLGTHGFHVYRVSEVFFGPEGRNVLTIHRLRDKEPGQ